MSNSTQHNEDFPDSDPSQSRATWYILDAKRNQFAYRSGSQDLVTDKVKGYFRGLHLEWFEGKDDPDPKKQVTARYELCISMASKDGELMKLKCSSKVPFYCFASKVIPIRSGQVIHVALRPLGTTTGIDLDVYKGGAWEIVKGGEIPKSDDPDVKVVWATHQLFLHPDYELEAEVPGPDGGARAFLAGAQAGSGTKPEGSTPGSSSSPSAEGATSTSAPRQTHAHIPSDPPKVHEAFGYEFKMWPPPEFWAAPPSEKQKEMFGKKITEVFEGNRAKAITVADALHVALGVERKNFDLWSKAQMGVALDFLNNSQIESIHAAELAGNPGAGVASPFDAVDEYA